MCNPVLAGDAADDWDMRSYGVPPVVGGIDIWS
jgi:hypothetical protein